MTHRTINILISTLVVGTSCLGLRCVNVDDPAYPKVPDFRASARFVHVATDAPAAGAVTVDGAVVGTIAFGQATPYMNFPAGTRNIGFAGITQPVLLNTDFEGTILIHALSRGNRFVYLHEGPRIGSKNNPDTVLIRFVNAALGSAPNISFVKDDSATGASLSSDVAFGSSPSYRRLAPGNYTIFGVSNGSYLATIAGSQVVPPVTGVLSSGTGTFTLTVSGGLSYNISVTSDNSQGFYTAAHFHNARPGSNGPIVRAIDVSGQQITFQAANLSGAQQVPPVQTSASGTGVFTLRANSARDTFSLVYSISVTADTLDTIFTAAHFHNAPLGQNGSIVHTIISTPFRDTLLTGRWNITDTAMVRELLLGRIYVNFHTSNYPSGAIRDQLMPTATSTNTFTGTWSNIPSALRDSVVAGSIYVNFHTFTHTGGQIRGQLVVDPSGGHYGVASLPPETFADGEMHTVVAVGAGPSMELLRFSDRTVGAGKHQAEIIREAFKSGRQPEENTTRISSQKQ